ncbi:MAG: prephenate dehydrogenase/arogenate dehydrogenase family protein [Candidatus Methanomethylophilaceae archaeon]|nr:prephenate dehydrogenase/arogenate dehydrogenase family protein [Candidatus Methanomethylophilaceae archaeon]
MSTDDRRKEIADIDMQILDLCRRRLELARGVGEDKAAVGADIRNIEVEEKVIDRYRGYALDHGMDPVCAESICRTLMQESIALQATVPRKTFEPRHVAIIGGNGKMGRWFADLLSKSGHRVDIIDPSAGNGLTMEDAKWADVIIVSIPISRTSGVLERLATIARKDALIFDVASLKSPSVEVLRRMAKDRKVCSIHPMFGPSAGSMYGRNLLVCDCGCGKAVEEAVALFKDHGGNIRVMPVEDHDKYMSYVLGLSHAVNIAFFTVLERSGISYEDMRSVASTTYSKLMDTNVSVALEDPYLYYEIQHLNSYRESMLEEFDRSVKDVVDAALSDDPRPFKNLMDKGREYFFHRGRPLGLPFVDSGDLVKWSPEGPRCMTEMTTMHRMILFLGEHKADPYDMYRGCSNSNTQNGIAMALGISRAHASTTLGRLIKKNEVTCNRMFVKECNSFRNTYHLTSTGERHRLSILAELESDGVDIESAIFTEQLDHMATEDFITIPRSERDFVGMVCIMGRPFPMSQVPENVRRRFFQDLRGRILIKEYTRRRFLGTADEEERRRWNSMAADWLTDFEPDETVDRISHLTKSGRIREAVSLGESRYMELCDSPDDSELCVLVELMNRTDSEILSRTVARIAIRLGRSETAERYVTRLMYTDPEGYHSILSEIEVLKGNGQESLYQALEGYVGDVPSCIALGKALIFCGRGEESLTYLRKARSVMIEEGCIFRMDEVLQLEARANAMSGNLKVADNLEGIRKAYRRCDVPAVSLDAVSKDGVVAERVHVGDV